MLYNVSVLSALDANLGEEEEEEQGAAARPTVKTAIDASKREQGSRRRGSWASHPLLLSHHSLYVGL